MQQKRMILVADKISLLMLGFSSEKFWFCLLI